MYESWSPATYSLVNGMFVLISGVSWQVKTTQVQNVDRRGSRRLHIVCIKWDGRTMFGSFVVNTLLYYIIDWFTVLGCWYLQRPSRFYWEDPTSAVTLYKWSIGVKRDEVTPSPQGLWLRQACWRFSPISSSLSEPVKDFPDSTTPEWSC